MSVHSGRGGSSSSRAGSNAGAKAANANSANLRGFANIMRAPGARRAGSRVGAELGTSRSLNGGYKARGANNTDSVHHGNPCPRQPSILAAAAFPEAVSVANASYPNMPVIKRQRGDFFSESVLSALATRPHATGRTKYTLQTNQCPADMELTLVHYKSKEELEADFSLKFEQCILSEVNPQGQCAIASVCEGYELVSVDRERVAPRDVVGVLQGLDWTAIKKRVPFTGLPLGFVSPLAEPPCLSDRQCSHRLGIGHIKEKMLLKATDTIEALLAGKGGASSARSARSAGSGRSGKSGQATPGEAAVKPGELSFQNFVKCLREAGILWLSTKQLTHLYENIDRDNSGGIDEDEWRQSLADEFLFNDLFAHLGAHVTRIHIRDISVYFERRMRKARRSYVEFNEFSAAVFQGGVTWLTREQLKWVFDYLDENNDGKLEFQEWTFDLIEAAQEIQRFLKHEEQFGDLVIPEEMDLELFTLTLHSVRVCWLNDGQVAEMFAYIDEDSSGIVTREEFARVGELVETVYARRETAYGQRKSWNCTFGGGGTLSGTTLGDDAKEVAKEGVQGRGNHGSPTGGGSTEPVFNGPLSKPAARRTQTPPPTAQAGTPGSAYRRSPSWQYFPPENGGKGDGGGKKSSSPGKKKKPSPEKKRTVGSLHEASPSKKDGASSLAGSLPKYVTATAIAAGSGEHSPKKDASAPKAESPAKIAQLVAAGKSPAKTVLEATAGAAAAERLAEPPGAGEHTAPLAEGPSAQTGALAEAEAVPDCPAGDQQAPQRAQWSQAPAALGGDNAGDNAGAKDADPLGTSAKT